MNMHNPPHPGEFIKSVYLNEFGISIRKVAENLAVSPSSIGHKENHSPDTKAGD